MQETLLGKTLPLVGNPSIPIERIDEPFLNGKGILLNILRLDLIHQVLSGNKVFKLLYYLREAAQMPTPLLLTFGGPYSNHLAATSYACKNLGIRSIGIVRGDKLREKPHTLQFCTEQGMELKFLPHELYRRYQSPDYSNELALEFGPHTLVPEGGFGPQGVKGARLINQYITPGKYTHLCVPVGSSVTLAGIMLGNPSTQIIAFPALKRIKDLDERLQELGAGDHGMLQIIEGYHFGGFAKHNPTLIEFMNQFYLMHRIALDLVYTSKMMFGIYDLARKDFFPEGSRILSIHTGGLQGNGSLCEGTLIF